MNTELERFVASAAAPEPPLGTTAPLRALWWLRKGEWARAHDLVQPFESGAGAWVHAHLHRVEGDLDNAAYWYRRAGQAIATVPLAEEWERIVLALLEDR